MILALLSVTILQGCLSRKEVNAELWMESGLPADLCTRFPELMEFGHFRKLNSGKYEVVPYCDPNARDYSAIRNKKLNEWMDKYLPEGK